MHYAQAPWTNTVPLCRDLTSPLAHSFFREMTAEAKNASSVNRREEFKAQKLRISQGPSSRRVTAPDLQDPRRPIRSQNRPLTSQSEARLRTSPCGLWPLSRMGAGRPENIPRPLSSPRALKTARLLCLIWSAEEQQVKRSPREHYLWSNKCRVALTPPAYTAFLGALMIRQKH